MSGYNLPPGCTISDLPGNSPQEMWMERFVERAMNDLSRFQEWFDYVTQDNRSSLSPKGMDYLMGYSNIERDYETYLEEVAERYYHLRNESDYV